MLDQREQILAREFPTNKQALDVEVATVLEKKRMVVIHPLDLYEVLVGGELGEGEDRLRRVDVGFGDDAKQDAVVVLRYALI